MRRPRREAMALWPFLVLQCVSMIGIMAEGRLLLIELMMPSPDWTKPPNGKEPIIEPISPPDICVDFPTAIGCPGAPIPMPETPILSSDPAFTAIPKSRKMPEEVPESATDADEPSSVDLQSGASGQSQDFVMIFPGSCDGLPWQ